ncbi:MAG: PilW family protein [Pseudomonadota bacterium]
MSDRFFQFSPGRPLSGSGQKRQLGLSLIELLVAMTLTLLLALGIGTIYTGSSQTFRSQEDHARIQEAGRFALDVIGRSVRQAGYRDVSSPNVNPDIAITWTPITGTNGSGSAPDTIALQYQWTSGDRSCDGDSAGATGNLVRDGYNLDAANLELQCDGVIAASPAALGAVPYGEPLVDGIEDLQFLYGIDTDADLSANRYVNAGSVANWGQVVSVKVCVLVHSTRLGSAASQRYLTCNGALGEDTTAGNDFAVAGDTSLRRTFIATFNLRNRVASMP